MILKVILPWLPTWPGPDCSLWRSSPVHALLVSIQADVNLSSRGITPLRQTGSKSIDFLQFHAVAHIGSNFVNKEHCRPFLSTDCHTT